MAEQVLVVPPKQITMEVNKYCTTKLKYSRFSYTWTIDGFLNRINLNDRRLWSQLFHEEYPRKLTWGLSVDPRILCPQGINVNVSFGIHLLQTVHTPVDAFLDFSILNPMREKVYHSEAKKTFFHKINCTTVHYFDILRDSIVSQPDTYIFGERLTVRLEVNVLDHEVTSGQSRWENQELELSKDYEKLLSSGSLSDVTFNVGAESFLAHKLVLAARSPIFQAMFQHDMLENATNVVMIADIAPQVFREMLLFIYTGKLSSPSVLDGMAQELLSAADKYGLDHLKTNCEEFLIGTISVETAVQHLMFAELSNAKGLKEGAIAYIKRNSAKVSLTNEWFQLKEYPDILAELAP